MAHNDGRPNGGFGSVVCPREDHCEDEVDNDGDDFTDCADRDCFFTPRCIGIVDLPGRVEAERYKWGGEGIAYHDSDPGNNGFVYRFEDVDLGEDDEQDWVIGWTEAGEWTTYDVQVAASGFYNVTARVSSACGFDCPWTKVFRVTIDGAEAGFAFQSTGDDWWNYIDLPGAPQIWLEKGSHTLRLDVDAGGFDIDHLDFSLVSEP